MHHQIYFTARKVSLRLQLIESLVHRQLLPIQPFRYQKLDSPAAMPPVEVQFDDSAWPIIFPGDEWGEWQSDFILRTTFLPLVKPAARSMPSSLMPYALFLPLGEAGDFCHPEALVYLDGVPYAACDRNHQEVLLPVDVPLDGQKHSLALHGWTGLGGDAVNPRPGRLRMGTCYLIQIDQALRNFITIARLALGVAEKLDRDHPAKDALLTALDAAFKDLDTREPLDENLHQSVWRASLTLQEGIEQAGEPMPVALVASGHAHIDVAWLWTLGQTRRKAGRTFHNVLRLMEQYPDFHFTQSQPQLYEFIRQDYPELFRSIQDRVAQGRWEPTGGMWVEADCNLSGAESLARQFLLGRNFFRTYFGELAESPVLWLPDVFGYAWNLPQLIREAGLKYFFTIKIGWNQYNRLPYDTFWWQGLDGTRVLTHFSTAPDPGSYASTYNAMASPAEVIGAWENFQQKELRQPLFMAYGFGDGGGGPTAQMIENLSSMRWFPGTPCVRQGSVGAFFQEVEAAVGDDLPVWNGELYLELHRGTYTTQSLNKLANRRSEFLLHDAEFLATFAALLDPGYSYPATDLRQAWEMVCLNQFHDIIPGSSIGAVYAESQAQYARVRQLGERVRDKALEAISRVFGMNVLVANPTSFTRQGNVFVDSKLILPPGAQVQEVNNGFLVGVGEAPPYSILPLAAVEGNPTLLPVGASIRERGGEGIAILENSLLQIEFSLEGNLIRLFDKTARREILPSGGAANIFQAFEDRPNDWDAWDIDIHYEDKMWLARPATSLRVIESGPYRVMLEIKRTILSSAITQRISLTQNSLRLDFETTVDWRERHILLKVAFPVDILSPVATYEIQWGNVERPTHRNTSWDWARFETVAQKWVDLSEGGYGVSLLNNGRYGHDIQGNILRLTLLRSPTNPDPLADQGVHNFTYSLLPHSGAWDERIIAEAYALNDPWITWPGPGGVGEEHPGAPSQLSQQYCGISLFRVDDPALVIETIKRSEDSHGVIVRLYESQRTRGSAWLHCAFPVKAAWRVNLLEEEISPLVVEDRRVHLTYRPYEIISLKIEQTLGGVLVGD